MEYKYNLTIWEKGGAILHPSYVTPEKVSVQTLIEFFGLNEPDIFGYMIRLEGDPDFYYEG